MYTPEVFMSQIEIGQWGNSAGIRLHSNILQAMGCAIGSTLELTISDGALIIRPAHRHTLDQLLAQCPEHNALDDEDRAWLSDGPAGKEIL
jgi:antitoxin ChpS